MIELEPGEVVTLFATVVFREIRNGRARFTTVESPPRWIEIPAEQLASVRIARPMVLLTLQDVSLLSVGLNADGSVSSIVRDEDTGAIMEIPGGPVQPVDPSTKGTPDGDHSTAQAQHPRPDTGAAPDPDPGAATDGLGPAAAA